MARYLPTKSVVCILVLILLMGAGIMGWFVIRYPATTGHTQYTRDVPTDFNFADAKQALVSAGYSVEAYYDVTYYEHSYLRITGSTNVKIMVDEAFDRIDITATRVIYILPYEVFRDLDEVSVEQHEIAVRDIREILYIIDVRPIGTFTHVNERDSLDYFIPTSAFYVLVSGHLPLMVVLAVLIVKESKKGDAPFLGQEPPNNRTQY